MDKEEISEIVDKIIAYEVSVYNRSDYSGMVYIYNGLAYIGETGYDNMVEQIKIDHKIVQKEGK